MSYCLNPNCKHTNSNGARFCQKCRSQLLINERYRAIEVIAQGGFGKTYLAIDEGKPSRPRCVIKQFTYQCQNEKALQAAMQLFEQEAVRLDDLGRHPQIPELLGFAKLEDRQYLIQEFIDGQNLERELATTGAFTEARIRPIIEDVLTVLQFIHSKKVIHRDIKPENIIRRLSDGKAVLVDFGAAKHAISSALGTVIGTPLYAAPEQTRGLAIPASDLYSLGVTCIRLLTKVPPLKLKNLDGEWIWRDFLHKDVISDSFGKFLDKLTAAKPTQRYQSVEDALNDLNSVTTSSSSFSFPVIPNQPPTLEINITQRDGGASIDLIHIPTGKFVMGSNEQNKEKPPHEVSIGEFYIGKYPVTQKQWQAVMGNNPSNFRGDDLPVDQVSWYAARMFCQKLAQKTGRKIRLPTEAEWEYAARGATKDQSHIYAGSNNVNEVAWHRGNSNQKTHGVGLKKPNEMGLYDLSGNVWEWCWDDWHDDYNSKSDRFKKNGNEPWLNPNPNEEDIRYCILRGGSWGYAAEYCRLTARSRYAADGWLDFFGFRIVVA